MIFLFSVDQIIDDIVILEDINTKEKREVDIDILPDNIKEGSILKYENNLYYMDLDVEQRRRSEFRERLERLKNNNW